MRLTLIVPLLALATFAQARPAEPEKAQSAEARTEAAPSTPPDADQQENRVAPEELLRRPGLPAPGIWLTPKGAAIPLAHGQPCAIPLINVLTKEAARMDEKMVIPLPPKDGPRQFTMKEVTPPAPSCDDIKR